MLYKIIRRILGRFLYHFKLNMYRMRIPGKVKNIRGKEKIKVLFIISEVASWKSELLYKTMLNHQKFSPVLGVSTSYAPSGAKKTLMEYLKGKEYDYIDLDVDSHSIKNISPDIIFYYKPYRECYSFGHYYDKNLKYVFCGLDYGFEATKHPAHIEKELFDYCWQFYVENEEMKGARYDVLGYRAQNTIVTGVPMQDILLLPKESFNDPWKDKTGKKRIIYAPHHSFKNTNGKGIEFATFMDFGEAMLNYAIKYSDKITIAFKPHPNLYMKLITIWGQKRTDAYYQAWQTMSNTQLETGEYVGLFKYSDAIIHDCASFIVEYLYMNNPSMYLVAETNNYDDMFNFVKDGYRCYEQGKCVTDIERFILEVIEGVDRKKDDRQSYLSKNLLPPRGKTACENIIDSILGE